MKTAQILLFPAPPPAIPPVVVGRTGTLTYLSWLGYYRLKFHGGAVCHLFEDEARQWFLGFLANQESEAA